MARRNEFRPDKPHSGFFDKLLLTRLQQRSVLRWGLYALLLVVLSVLQDVILCRIHIFGATTELVPCGIFLICVTEGLEKGSVFSLIAACIYLFSGTPAGNYVLVFIPALAICVTLFRQSYLRKGFAATMLCTAVAMLVYELAVFCIGVFFGQTTPVRIGTHFLTGVLTLVTAPLLYPVINAISIIGGDAWKE